MSSKTLVFHPAANARILARNFFTWQGAGRRHSRQLRRLEGDETTRKKYRKELAFFAGWDTRAEKHKQPDIPDSGHAYIDMVRWPSFFISPSKSIQHTPVVRQCQTGTVYIHRDQNSAGS